MWSVPLTSCLNFENYLNTVKVTGRLSVGIVVFYGLYLVMKGLPKVLFKGKLNTDARHTLKSLTVKKLVPLHNCAPFCAGVSQ